jgi:D-aminopeptidase
MPASEKSINVVAGETNDAYFNDIKGCHVKPEHVAKAIEDCSETVVEGCAGAGAGISCYGFKSGIGTSSRVIPGIHLGEKSSYMVGALVQANFGGNLNIYGHQLPFATLPEKEIKGSCMIIVATDAPVDARQLKRIAKRGILGMASTGSYMSHGSGDFCIAFSNYAGNLRSAGEHHMRTMTILSDEQLNPLFEATADAVRESIYNCLTMSDDVAGSNKKNARGFNIEEYRHMIPLK